jgi:hypothetical protein
MKWELGMYVSIFVGRMKCAYAKGTLGTTAT